MSTLFTGFSYNMRGLNYFISHRVLWKYALVPFFLGLLIFSGLISVYLNHFSDVLLFFQKPFQGLDIAMPQGILDHTLDALLWFVRQAMTVVVFLISSVFLVVLCYFFTSVISGPFYEGMADKILKLQGRDKSSTITAATFAKKWSHAVKVEIFKISFYIVVTLALILLSLLPVVGVLFSFIGLVFTSWYFAFGLCAYPMIEELRPLRHMLAWGMKNKLGLIGFGLPSLIPFVGFLFLQVQVVGGTLFYLDCSEV